VIGFLLCAKEGPPVNFLTPKNPIEKLEGATKALMHISPVAGADAASLT